MINRLFHLIAKLYSRFETRKFSAMALEASGIDAGSRRGLNSKPVLKMPGREAQCENTVRRSNKKALYPDNPDNTFLTIQPGDSLSAKNWHDGQ